MVQTINDLKKVIKNLIKEEINFIKLLDYYIVTGINSDNSINIKQMNSKISYNNVEIVGTGYGNGRGLIILPNINDIVVVGFIQNSETPVIFGTTYDIFSTVKDDRILVKQNEFFVNNKINGAYVRIDKNNNIILNGVNDVYVKIDNDGNIILSEKNGAYVKIDKNSIITLNGDSLINGSLDISGALTKSSGSFDIPHPDANEEKKGYRLRHYFVESPTAGDNIYRYEFNVKNGYCKIQLPDYFSYLNKNPQIWVNAKEHFGKAYGKIVDNILIVNADMDGIYNVLIIGTRKDKIAQEHYKKYGVIYKK